MKKILFLVLIISLPLMMSCEKRLFHFIATIDKDTIYAIDQTGAFNQQATISSQDITGQLDIPEDGRITGVNVESLSLKVVVNEQNQAQTLNVSGYLIDNSNQQQQVFNNYEISLSGVNTPFIGLNNLIAVGISSLKNKLENYILNNDFTTFQIAIDGDSVPAGQRIDVDLILKFKATVNYDQCMDVPAVLNSGEDCDIE